MHLAEAKEEYSKALRMGQKDYKERKAKGKASEPAVLDQILEDQPQLTTVEVGLVEIPIARIVGTKSAGRIAAFTASFLPVLDLETEFAYKWCELYASHVFEEGIHTPIICFEYLGYFYVQEGNKRVSVLRYCGAPTVPANVFRVIPTHSDAPQIQAYEEFLEFYSGSGTYDVSFRNPGDYARLLAYLGKGMGEKWTEREQKTFRAYFQYFKEAFLDKGGDRLDLLPEEALLLWLRVHSFRELGNMSSDQIKKSVAALWEDMVAIAQKEPVQLQTEPTEGGKPGILSKLIGATPQRLQVAFIHTMDSQVSTWCKGHEEGAEYLLQALGDKVSVYNYYWADTPERADDILEQAVADGAQVVFTTTPSLSRSTLKAAVEHPKVRFLNCSVDAPYSSVRAYYGRIFEGKFITGAIAGAMAEYNEIGYIGSYPIYGVPASINAFALGAQLTNPRAKIQLEWSCLPGEPVKTFIEKGIKVISNRDVPVPDKAYLNYCDYGTYMVEENGQLSPLGSPCWLWGPFYEQVIRSIMDGSWEQGKTSHQAVNYWWGMDSGVIDVKLAEQLPEGVRILANILREGLQSGRIDPFRRMVIAQDGSIKNDGQRSFTVDELLHMDYLVDNVEGFIPEFEDVLPMSRSMVRELGLHREQIPMEKEGML